jgi:PhoH-like ATPase
MAKKNYLIDTNVLLHDPNSIYAFEDNNVYILISVLEELDKFKTAPGETGANARRVAKALDTLREKGNLNDGVPMDNGGTIYVTTYRKNGLNLDLSIVDNRLITTAHKLSIDTKLKSVVVTKDIGLRVRADGVKVNAEDYESGKYKVESYHGHSTVFVPDDVIDRLYEDKVVTNDYFDINENGDFCVNHYFILKSETDIDHTGLARLDSDGSLVTVRTGLSPCGISALSVEQTFALDALLNPSIPLVSLRGMAGTGKTLLAIAAAISRAVDDHDECYKVTITRPIVPVGNDIGFIPGDVDEKMGPWMRPIYDALDKIKECDGKPGKRSSIPANFDNSSLLEITPLVYVRGRSIAHSFMVIDEAQNMTPLEVKTLLTRASDGSKVVLTGDIEQIDSPYLDSESNGFSYLISRLKGQDIFAHIELEKGERGKLAEVAAKYL